HLHSFPTRRSSDLGGIIPIREFATMPMTKDILVKIIIKKSPVKIVYMSQRNTKTDFPVLTLAMSKLNSEYLCVIGARPLKAIAFNDENHILDNGINKETEIRRESCRYR